MIPESLLPGAGEGKPVSQNSETQVSHITRRGKVHPEDPFAFKGPCLTRDRVGFS